MNKVGEMKSGGLPGYKKPYGDFIRTAKVGSRVRLHCHYRDDRKGTWIPYTVDSVVKEMATNCVIVKSREYGVPYYMISDWEILS